MNVIRIQTNFYSHSHNIHGVVLKHSHPLRLDNPRDYSQYSSQGMNQSLMAMKAERWQGGVLDVTMKNVYSRSIRQGDDVNSVAST